MKVKILSKILSCCPGIRFIKTKIVNVIFFQTRESNTFAAAAACSSSTACSNQQNSKEVLVRTKRSVACYLDPMFNILKKITCFISHLNFIKRIATPGILAYI